MAIRGDGCGIRSGVKDPAGRGYAYGVDLVNLVGIAGIAIGAFSLLFAFLAWRSSERSVRASEEQLGIAREEALRYPKLEVSGVALLDAEGFEEVGRVREAASKWREVQEELQADGPQGFGDRTPVERWAFAIDAMKGYTIRQAEYEGPIPDLVLAFELRNAGRRTAREVSGELVFEPGTLRPIKFPRMSGATPSSDGTRIGLRVGAVPPADSGFVKVFRVALIREEGASGPTVAEVAFTTPEGDRWGTALDLRIP